MTLNTCYPKSGQYNEKWHFMAISAAGPIITIIQAIIVYYLIKRNSNKHLFPFLLSYLYTRFLAGLLNFINPNDEGRISIELGIGKFTLSIVVVGFLFYLTQNVIKSAGFKTKFIVITTLLYKVYY